MASVVVCSSLLPLAEAFLSPSRLLWSPGKSILQVASTPARCLGGVWSWSMMVSSKKGQRGAKEREEHDMEAPNPRWAV